MNVSRVSTHPASPTHTPSSTKGTQLSPIDPKQLKPASNDIKKLVVAELESQSHQGA